MTEMFDMFHEEVHVSELEYNPEYDIFQYPCPCGDLFEITRDSYLRGDRVAECPSCSLKIKLICTPEEEKSFLEKNFSKFPICA